MRFQLGTAVSDATQAEPSWSAFYETPGPDAKPEEQWALLLSKDLMVPFVRSTLRSGLVAAPDLQLEEEVGVDRVRHRKGAPRPAAFGRPRSGMNDYFCRSVSGAVLLVTGSAWRWMSFQAPSSFRKMCVTRSADGAGLS